MHTESVVYFVQAGPDGPIKIGLTTSLDSRLRALQTGSPRRLTLLHTEPGGRDRELALHRRWALHRLRGDGEWFAPAPAILNYIATAPDGARGRLAPSLAAIPWGKLLPRRRRRSRRRRSTGYAVRTLTGITRRLAIAAAAVGGLYLAGTQIAPAETEAVITLIRSWL